MALGLASIIGIVVSASNYQNRSAFDSPILASSQGSQVDLGELSAIWIGGRIGDILVREKDVLVGAGAGVVRLTDELASRQTAISEVVIGYEIRSIVAFDERLTVVAASESFGANWKWRSKVVILSSASGELRQVSAVELVGGVSSVAVHGDLVIVARSPGGIATIDLSDPKNPILTDMLDMGRWIGCLAVREESVLYCENSWIILARVVDGVLRESQRVAVGGRAIRAACGTRYCVVSFEVEFGSKIRGQVLDITNAKLEPIINIGPMKYAQTVAVRDEQIFISSGSELGAFSILDNQLVTQWTTRLPGEVRRVSVGDSRVCVSVARGGMMYSDGGIQRLWCAAEEGNLQEFPADFASIGTALLIRAGLVFTRPAWAGGYEVCRASIDNGSSDESCLAYAGEIVGILPLEDESILLLASTLPDGSRGLNSISLDLSERVSFGEHGSIEGLNQMVANESMVAVSSGRSVLMSSRSECCEFFPKIVIPGDDIVSMAISSDLIAILWMNATAFPEAYHLSVYEVGAGSEPKELGELALDGLPTQVVISEKSGYVFVSFNETIGVVKYQMIEGELKSGEPLNGFPVWTMATENDRLVLGVVEPSYPYGRAMVYDFPDMGNWQLAGELEAPRFPFEISVSQSHALLGFDDLGASYYHPRTASPEPHVATPTPMATDRNEGESVFLPIIGQ
jgi:hypothetical protein